MKRYLLILLALVSIDAYGQTDIVDQQITVAKGFFNDDKLREADSVLTNMLDSASDSGQGWDLLVKVRYKEYEKAVETDKLTGGLFDNITITTTKNEKDKRTRKEKKDDNEMAEQLVALLRSIKPSEKAYNALIYATRKATLCTRDAVYAAIIMRTHTIDVTVDTNISSKAVTTFNEAETEFGNKNYNKAALLYKQAIDESPDFYKARLYLGDCYYATSNYDEAINSFKEAVNQYPTFLEPRKYLADTYSKLGLYSKALDEIIYTMAIYPDYSNFQKMDQLADITGKKINIMWTRRGVLPRAQDTVKKNVNEFININDAIVSGPWIYYVAARNRLISYCNEKGLIVKPNSYTTSKYLELYCWEEMLKNSNDPILDEARRMKKLNYLDCYVLVSCFHNDLYAQYHFFAINNKDKITDYFKSCIKPK